VEFRYGVANALPAVREHAGITADLLPIPLLRGEPRSALAWHESCTEATA
jgi:hypothetical protein